MPDVRAALTAKLGPLPAWAWGLGLGGVVIAGRWLLARRGDNAAQNAPVSTADTAQVEGAAGGSGGGAAGVPAAAPNPGSFADTAITPGFPVDQLAPADNAQWLSLATTAVVRTTGVTVTAISDALSKYLAGQPITPVEESYVSRAIAALGYPPAGAPAIVRESTVGSGATAPKSDVTPWRPEISIPVGEDPAGALPPSSQSVGPRVRAGSP